MRGMGRSGGVCVVLALLGLACGVAGCGPNANAPPTDAEISSAYATYWNDKVPATSKFFGEDWYSLLIPVSAAEVGQSITRDSPEGKIYEADVAFRFRARADLIYQCTTGLAIPVHVAPSGATVRNSNGMMFAKKGDVISCINHETFQKVDEGWLMEISSGYSYLIRR